MAIKDDFTDDSFPLFLSEYADEPEQPDLGKAWDTPVISSRIFKTGILVVTATAVAIGIALLWVGNPVAFLANVTASLVDISALQASPDQSTPTIQSTAGSQVLTPTARDEPPANSGTNPESAPPLDDKAALRPPTSGSTIATDAPTRNETAAASEPTDQSQTENREASSDALFKQFQAWKAERAQTQPAQDAAAQVVQDARPQVRAVKEHRQVRPDKNARAEIRPVQNPLKKVRREQNAQVQVPPVQDARAQNQPVQSAQAPSFLQSLGWRN
jgi:hypothetical protein